MIRDENYSFDNIAENVFAPIYPVIADDIIKNTNISQGIFLELGCGGGHLGLQILKKTNMTGYLIDIHPKAVEFASKRLENEGFSSRAEVSIQDVHNLPFQDNSMDLIFSRGSMGFWKDIKLAFTEIWRALKVGGKTYIGGGLGNYETQKIVQEKMKKIDSNWPNSIKRNQHQISNEEFENMFEELQFNYKILDTMESGRWIILEKTI